MIVAYRPDIITEPLAEELARIGWQTRQVSDPGLHVADGTADIALGPALGYGEHLGGLDFGLLPNFGVTLSGITGLLRIAFRPGGSELTKLAVRSTAQLETIAAGLVLIEKHDIEPEFVEVGEEGDYASMLEEGVDGAVLSGGDALASALRKVGGLDLGDEWEDLTGEPFPYLLAWGNSTRITEREVREFQGARDRFLLSLPDLAARSEQPELLEALHQAYLSGQVQFSIAPEDLPTTLNPLFHYAFYHGIIQDIPTIKMVPPQERTEDGDGGVGSDTVH